MAVMNDPDSSRRLATALYRRSLSPDKRVNAMNAAKRAKDWEDLPKWLREFVAETEEVPPA